MECYMLSVLTAVLADSCVVLETILNLSKS